MLKLVCYSIFLFFSFSQTEGQLKYSTVVITKITKVKITC